MPPNLPVWRVASSPDLRIGAADGPGPDVFGRVTDLAVRGDGSLIVADDRSFQIKAFDSSGKSLWSAGRAGQGPGEFRNLRTVVATSGDSVITSEAFGSTLQVFSPAGVYVRSFMLVDPVPQVFPSGVRPPPVGVALFGGFTDGTLVTSPGAPRTTSADPAMPGRALFQIMYHDRTGRVVRTLQRFPLTERVRREDRLEYLDMGPSSVLAIGGNSILVADQERFEVMRYGSNGSLNLILRVARPRVPTDQRAYAALGRDRLVPEFLPALDQIRVDAAGRLWIQEYVPPYETRAATWWIFTNDGRPAAQIVLPAGFTVHEAMTDSVLGVTRDQFGVEYVERYRIIR
jgi:hypothetical protein